MKLLAVDDSQVTRKVIKAVAAALRIDTEEAEDGIEALEKLSDIYNEIDLILLDWNMPEKNGYDTLLEIKENNNFKHIPVMMVTTEGQRRNIVAAIKAGADNYLTKPFTVDELESKILECLQKEDDFV